MVLLFDLGRVPARGLVDVFQLAMRSVLGYSCSEVGWRNLGAFRVAGGAQLCIQARIPLSAGLSSPQCLNLHLTHKQQERISSA